MISGANEEQLELAEARMDIMLATNYTTENLGPLAIIDKYHDKEIDRLNNIISETSKDIQHELSHLKAKDEVTWNEEFYTNDKLDYRKLCIALLEQVVNKLKEKE